MSGDSTFFFRDDHQDDSVDPIEQRLLDNSPVDHRPPQQSFIFGADQGAHGTRDTPRGGRGVVFTNQYQPTVPTAQEQNTQPVPGPSGRVVTQTHWGAVIRHWILSTVALPFYAIGLVTFTWKQAPHQLTKMQGVVAIVVAFVLYGSLWTLFGLIIGNANVRSVFSVDQAIFVVFLYLMSCFAESMLKNTQVVSASAMTSTSPDDTVRDLNQSGLVSLKDQRWSTAEFLNTIMFMSQASPGKVRSALLATVGTTLVYTGLILGYHIYQLLEASADQLKTSMSPLVVFVAVDTILQATLCFIVLYPLSQVALRLSVRAQVARLFAQSTARHGAGEDHTFALDSLQNVRAWQLIRDTLLQRYAFPTLYVDVVLSTAFTLWIPLVVVGALDFLFRATITPLAVNAISLAVLVLSYLLVCVVLASQVQEILSNTEILRWQEYHFLVIDPRENGDADHGHLTRVLKRLAELIDSSRQNAVVFQVWGFPLNQKMATFLGGVLVTLASSVVVRLASKVVSM